MIFNKKIVVVMPAYHAEKTIEMTYREIPMEFVDDVILVDDASCDQTVKIAQKLSIPTIVHLTNKGYGANQKTCYREALALGADIVIMLHPDYQYTPKLIPAMASMIASGQYDVVLASRIIGGGALKGGMPLYKYIANRFLTMTENIMLGTKLSEYHTGYRAFSKEVLASINYHANSDDFVFDNQMLSQIIYQKYEIAEITCPTKYFADASSINFRRSMKYGFGVLGTSFKHFFQRIGIAKYKIYQKPSVK
jgi:glycosyltransferase involved in cell wall biosynthesis